MVAAHNDDLKAAKARARTAFVPRPTEGDVHADEGVDVEVADLEALADSPSEGVAKPSVSAASIVSGGTVTVSARYPASCVPGRPGSSRSRW